MKLSDIMGHAGLSMYAEIALVLFVLVFLGIVIRTFAPSRSAELNEAALLPLDEPTAARVRQARHS
jgi:cbb3-type cytochrome oxidase subunit 3